MRSIIPEYVNVMALTATATVSTRKDIIKSLDMQNPVVVSVSPMKENIYYCVSKKVKVNESFLPICEKLASQRAATDRMIIFCRRYDEITSISSSNLENDLQNHLEHLILLNSVWWTCILTVRIRP